MQISRRKFIAAAAVGGAGVLGAKALTKDSAPDRGLQFSSFDDALVEAQRLLKSAGRVNHAEWPLGKVLQHCAQSIEMSVTGFPEHKPDWFKATLGAGAFNYFSWQGQMSHDLAEAIPGAPEIAADSEASEAFNYLQQSITRFETADQLQAHFAFGVLTKSDYRKAHLLHIADHLSAFASAT